MKNKFKMLLIGIAALGCGVTNIADANNIDTYRQLLANNTLTLKYENITPIPRATNKDKMNFYGSDGMSLDKADFLLNRKLEGIVVINGDDKYEEVAAGAYSMCSLTKGGSVYYFTKTLQGGKPVYYGSNGKKNQVVSTAKNIQGMLLSGSSYADSTMTRLLSAILPGNQKSADMPAYSFVGSGWLDNGLNYEDYKTEGNGVFEAIRYYFNGYSLVKIAAANYYTADDGSFGGNKFIIKVNEFSPTPDLSYLKLPDGVKDVTKK